MKLGEEFETEWQPMEMEQYFCDDRLSPQMCVCWVAFIAFHFGVLPAALCQNDVTCLNEDSECQEQKERKENPIFQMQFLLLQSKLEHEDSV